MRILITFILLHFSIFGYSNKNDSIMLQIEARKNLFSKDIITVKYELINCSKENYIFVLQYDPAAGDTTFHSDDYLVIRPFLYYDSEVVGYKMISFSKREKKRFSKGSDIVVLESGDRIRGKLQINLSMYGDLDNGNYKLLLVYYGGTVNDLRPYNEKYVKNFLNKDDIVLFNEKIISNTIKFSLK